MVDVSFSYKHNAKYYIGLAIIRNLVSYFVASCTRTDGILVLNRMEKGMQMKG